MFTPQDVGRHKNLSKTVLEFYARHYWTSGLGSTLSLDAFLYKCLGNGFTMKFGLAIYESIHKTLQLAGVPFDVESSVSINSTGMVTRVYAEPVQWKHALEANLLKVESLMATQGEDAESTRGGQYHEENLWHRIYSMVLDTGATQMLVWDEQDSFLEDRRPAIAKILGAQEGSAFNATSRGNLLMACFLKKPQERETLNPARKAAVFPSRARRQGSCDVARPLEMFTYGWYSRARINKELCRFVLPGTMVLAHLSSVKGSNVAQPKADWMVAKGMLGKQLIVYYPITKQERKITSYTVVQPPKGNHWRDMLGIEYEAPWACKPLPGDDEADRMARVTKTFVEMTMPEKFKGQLNKIRMPKTVSMVKHIQEEGVDTIKPPSEHG